MIISKRDAHYPHYDHPHTVIISIFVEFFNKYFNEADQIDYFGLDENFKNLLNLQKKNPSIYVGHEYGECFSLAANWWEDLSFDVNNMDQAINGIDEFECSSKYLALITSSEWEFFNSNCPYDFPAVFYLGDELRAWLVWAVNKRLLFFPKHKNNMIELVEKHIDVSAALALMQKKLNNEESWEFGPARKHEPKMILWHERTKNKEMNDWIRQWIE